MCVAADGDLLKAFGWKVGKVDQTLFVQRARAPSMAIGHKKSEGVEPP